VKFIIACLVAAIVLPAAAQAQTTFYGPQGQYRGQAQPNIGGGATYYGPQGQYQGQATPKVGGGYTYYGPQGQYQGQSTGPIGGYRR
jgi:hypothetical protein